ncbi:MAG: inositol monophosphatase [Sphaerochaetaceae bacterium]|nr:inositol monophosphatase [Sphaerochaetaceae bacterium]
MDKFDRLQLKILEMGEYACESQKDIHRDYKNDGSVLTQVDTFINNALSEQIAELFPRANIITEESLSDFDPKKEMTFILDPIDGTDVYSQGLPGWCISIGILDRRRTAVGAMVHAPRWGLSRDEGLLLRLDPGCEMMMNGKPYSSPLAKNGLEQLAMASHAPRYVDITRFKGKIRCYGSNILHMISPLIHNHIQGSISVPCFAWDIAGAHALLSSQNLPTVYSDGRIFEYDDAILRDRKKFNGILYSGTAEAVSAMRQIFRV